MASDPKTRRINEILHHKCEFTDEMCEIRVQRQNAVIDCHERITRSLGNAIKRGQLPADTNPEHAALAIFAYIDGLIRRWLLLPDSFDLLNDAERWADAGLDMLRLSPALRN